MASTRDFPGEANRSQPDSATVTSGRTTSEQRCEPSSRRSTGRRIGPWGTSTRAVAGAAGVAWGLAVPHPHPWLALPLADSRLWGAVAGVVVLPAAITLMIALRGRGASPLGRARLGTSGRPRCLRARASLPGRDPDLDRCHVAAPRAPRPRWLRSPGRTEPTAAPSGLPGLLAVHPHRRLGGGPPRPPPMTGVSTNGADVEPTQRARSRPGRRRRTRGPRT